MRKVDVLIIGQGLAGTILYDYLNNAGFSSLIVDKYRKITSSKVAAGIMNPITGRRFAKTWLAEKIFPHSIDYYTNKEKELKAKFYYNIPVHRYLSTIEDQNTWMGRSVEPELQQFIGSSSVEIPKQINSDFGGAEIIGGGYLATEHFLTSFRDNLQKSKSILDKQVNENDLMITDDRIFLNSIEAKYIIFCEGYKAVENNLFSWLPFTLAKGEVFDLKIPELPTDRIYNKNGFIMPRENGIFKMGATYRWNEMNEEPTQRSREELIAKTEKIINCEYEIVSQKAAIRPTVKDRRPIIGKHPIHKNVFIFNGFGSKGVTLIPFFAEHFTNCLKENIPIMEEVNVNRFYNYYDSKEDK